MGGPNAETGSESQNQNPTQDPDIKPNPCGKWLAGMNPAQISPVNDARRLAFQVYNQMGERRREVGMAHIIMPWSIVSGIAS